MKNFLLIAGSAFAFQLGTAGVGAGISTSDMTRVDGHLCDERQLLICWKKTARILGQPLATCSTARLLDALQLPPGVTLENNRCTDALIEASGGTKIASSSGLDFSTFQVVRLNGRLDVVGALAVLSGHPLLEYAEPDGFGSGGGVIPNDPDFGLQWHLEKISATNAWIYGQGSTNVILAVLDTGLNQALPEFAGRLVPGYDFVNNDEDPDDDHGHGTAVAGAAAATADNAMLVAGVTWNSRIMPIKVLDNSNNGLYSWWAAAIDFAVTNGAKVINLSAGGTSSNSTLTQSILQAIEAGVIFVCITHNDSSGTIRFPGRIPESITVGSTDQEDNKASFSNWGPEIDLVAPGLTIYTVGNGGNLTSWFGTSLSAPLVSGVACLISAVRPNLTQAQMHTLLCASAEDEVGGILDIPGFDNFFGWGRLNADYALKLALAKPTAESVTTGGVVTIQWPVPENAETRKPFDVAYSSNLVSWITIESPTNLAYAAGAAVWTDDGTEASPEFLESSNRHYRLEIQCR